MFARVIYGHLGAESALTLAALLRDIVADRMGVSGEDAREAGTATDAESAADSSPTDRGP